MMEIREQNQEVVVAAEREYWWAWSQVEGVGPVLMKRLQGVFGSLGAAWTAEGEALQQVEGIGSKLATAIAHRRTQFPSPPTEPYLTPADPDYPPLLFEISDPPPVLYYEGDSALLRQCQTQAAVGIVGTRSPSDYGRRWTRRLSQRLVQGGAMIISGLAEGIDREAHHSCLAQGGKTIAVLGTGVDRIYPPSNRDLHGAIARAGLLLSEYPRGTGPDRAHFPRRNRIIAGLSRITLVTEAPLKSGALITARLANDYGREVYVVPSSLDNPQGAGCLALVAQGAQLVLTEQTLLEALGNLPLEPDGIHQTTLPLVSPPVAASPAPTPPPDLSPLLQAIWQVLTPDPQPLDALVLQLPQCSTGDILGALTQLELLGLAEQQPGNRYQRATP